MSGSMMVQLGFAMIAGSVVLSIILNIIFAFTRRKTIEKIYSDIENN